MTDKDIQRMKTEDIRKGFHPAESHTELIGLSNRDLRLRSADATHQHYKGGLYRALGFLKDADTGEFLLGKDGEPRVVYEHVYPHARERWIRDSREFFGKVEQKGAEPVDRFRSIS